MPLFPNFLAKFSHCGHAGVVSAALIFFSGAAMSAPVVIYQNDFENPVNTACPNYNGNASAGTLVTDYGADFIQIQTVDRLCVDGPTDPAADRFLDPSGLAGKYFAGFYASYQTSDSESFGLMLSLPANTRSVSGTVDFANVKLAGYSLTTTSPNIGSPVNVTVNYYRLPADEAGFTFDPPTTLGAAAPVRATTSGTVLTPIQSDVVTVTNNSSGIAPEYTLDWTTHPLSVDASSLASGDRLIIAFTGLASHEYMAVDNLVIAANVPDPAPVPVDAWWLLLLASLGLGWLANRQLRG